MIIKIIQFMIRYWQIKTRPVHYAKKIGVKIGCGCKIMGMQGGTFDSEPYLVQLGDNVEITYGVRFITHDGGVWVGRKKNPEIDIIAPIKVGSNVLIGTNSVISPGVSIVDNVVIGAGSVVTRDISSGIVAAGVPAKPINSTERYMSKAKERSLDTHLLPDDEKKRYLIDYYNIEKK